MARQRIPLADRFWPKVDRRGPDECWLWTAAISAAGYGVVNRGGNDGPALAHRVAYELTLGPIPEGTELDHLCRVTACVNPAHLEPVTHAENIRRGAAYTKPECANGHPRTPENLAPNGGGSRRCRVCKREQEQARRAVAA